MPPKKNKTEQDAGGNLLTIQRAMGIATPHKGRKIREEFKILREEVPKLDTNVLTCSENDNSNLPRFISEFKVFKQELMGFDRDVQRHGYSLAFKKALVHMVRSTDGLSYLKQMGTAAGLIKPLNKPNKLAPTTNKTKAELLAKIAFLEEENQRLRMKYEPDTLFEPDKLFDFDAADAMEALYQVKDELANGPN